jgi:ElaB/YqjD/DUF883 family membrane-anchored ribosome-binding protein
MSQRATEVTKDQLVEEFKEVVTDTEKLLQSVATAGGEKVDVLRTGVEKKLASAKQRLFNYQAEAAKATNVYVHENPWKAIGMAAGVNIIAGLVLGMLLHRR